MNDSFLVRLAIKKPPRDSSGYRSYNAIIYCPRLRMTGNGEHGRVRLPYDLKLDIPGMEASLSLGKFLEEFRKGEATVEGGGLQVGRWLYKCLFETSPKVHEYWQKARALWEREGNPLRLEIVFPYPSAFKDSVANLEELPFELLANRDELLFRKPGYTLVRCYDEHSIKTFKVAPRARVMLAWANPKLESYESIAANVIEEHKAAFEDVKATLDWEVAAPCENATREKLKVRLNEAKTPILSIVAHGVEGGGALLLEAPEASTSLLKPDELATLCKNGGVKVAMLWTCHGAKWRANTGSLAEALLNATQGDVTAVITAHGALNAADTATLARELLKSLAGPTQDLDQALFAARSELARGNIQWAIPVYYARPCDGESVTRGEEADASHEPWLADAPPIPSAFTGRKELLDQGIELLRQVKESIALVSVVGMPGIGKSAFVRMLAERAKEELEIERGLWISADRTDVHDLRTHIAIWLRRKGGYKRDDFEDDRQLARDIGRKPLLLVFDSAEVYLQDEDSRPIFRKLLEMLRSHCPCLRMVLVTQKALEEDGKSLRETKLPVKALAPEHGRHLFLSWAGGDATEATDPEESRAQEELLEELCGHPRALVLTAGQLAKGERPGAVLEDLKKGYLESIKLPGAAASAKDEKETRDKRLVSAFSLAYKYLKAAHPHAAEVFVWMADTLPAGATDKSLKKILLREHAEVVDVLLGENLVDKVGARFVIPAPLNIYARLSHPLI